MKNLEQINKEFFDKIAKYYDKRIFKRLLLNPVKKAVEFVNVKKKSKILDAGCGTGNLLKILEDENKGLELYGVDISKEMLKIARKKLKNAKIRLEAVEKLSFKKDYFDYVFSIDAFQLFYDYDLVMRNFYRILKKGGYLVVVDYSFGIFLNKIFNKIGPGNNEMHTALGFKELFKKYKFKYIKQKWLGLFIILTIGRK
ncbi:MAG: class I SAM-dependent methyltransferase [Nanoarchaeota archaeon]